MASVILFSERTADRQENDRSGYLYNAAGPAGTIFFANTQKIL